MSNEALETLTAVRAKIADEKHWTQGAYARDSARQQVEPLALSACQWCAVGAIYAVPASDGSRRAAWDSLAVLIPNWKMPQFNDGHTHAEVLALFDKAIASLEAA